MRYCIQKRLLRGSQPILFLPIFALQNQCSDGENCSIGTPNEMVLITTYSLFT